MSDNNSTLDSIRKLWEHTSLAGRISVGVGALIVTAILAGVSYWALSPHYVPLASNLSPQVSAEVISLLEAEGIPCKRNYNGSGILVDQTRWSEANAIASNVVEPGKIEASGLGSGIILDPRERSHRNNLELEKRLAETVAQLDAVKSATVHLGAPETSVFIRGRQKKTASIFVELQPGLMLNRRVADSIASTVAHAVDGLNIGDITLSDTTGQTMSFGDDSMGGIIASQLDYQHTVEDDLKFKVESMLNEWVGPGRSVVRVAADIDFTRITEERNTYDPNSKVTVEEDSTSNSGTARDPLAVGVTGVNANLNGGNPRTSNSQVVSKEETLKSINKFGTINTTTLRQPGSVRRLTVSVVVGLGQIPAADGQPARQPPTLEAVEALIKNAVGFDPARNDEINVVQDDSLVGATVAEQVAQESVSTIDAMMPTILKGTLAFAAVVAMLIGWLTMRKVKPIELGKEEQEAISPQRARQLSELSLLARNNPELFKGVLSAWTGQVGDSDAGNQTSSAA